MVVRHLKPIALLLMTLNASAADPPSPDSTRLKASAPAAAVQQKFSPTAEVDPIDNELIQLGLWFDEDIAGATARVKRLKERLDAKLVGTWRTKWLDAWQHEIDVVTDLSKDQREQFISNIDAARKTQRFSDSTADHDELEKRVSDLLKRIDDVLDERCPSYLYVLIVRESVRAANQDHANALLDRQLVSKLRSDILGDWNPMYAIDSEWIGMSLARMDRFDDARRAFGATLKYRLLAYGPDRDEVYLTRMNLALLDVLEERYAEAIPALGEVLRKNFGSAHNQAVINAKCLYGLGVSYGRTKRPLEAEAAFQSSLREYRKFLAPTHPLVLKVLGDQLRFYEETKQEANATKLREEIETLRIKK